MCYYKQLLMDWSFASLLNDWIVTAFLGIRVITTVSGFVHVKRSLNQWNKTVEQI